MTRIHQRGMPTIYVDFLLIMLLAFLLLINPPKDSETAPPPGNMTVVITWPEGNDDVDLWTIGPGQQVATGYSHRGGALFNLLRDDLGNSSDTMPLNLEHAFSRGLPAGQYTVNVHCFRCAGTVTVSIEVRAGQIGAYQLLLFREAVKISQNQERTVISFKLDDNGKVVPGSANRVFRKLR